MATIVAPGGVDKNSQHYISVRETMRKRGAPTIRAVWNEGWGCWIAIEGSHRLAAACELGLEPVIKDISKQKRVRHDLQDYPSPCALSRLESWLTNAYRVNNVPQYTVACERAARSTVR